MRGDTRFPPNTLPGDYWPTRALVCFRELNSALQVKCCPHLAFTGPCLNPRGVQAWRQGARGGQTGCEEKEATL